MDKTLQIVTFSYDQIQYNIGKNELHFDHGLTLQKCDKYRLQGSFLLNALQRMTNSYFTLDY